MTGEHNIGSVAGVMGVTRSEFEALKESVNELKLLTKELRRRCLGEVGEFPNDFKQCITKFLNHQTPKINMPISLGIQQTNDDATSLESSTIMVDHPHVETVPTQPNVSDDQARIDSTEKSVDSTPIEDLQVKSQVKVAPMQATVSADQPHVVSTQKAAEIEIVPFPTTVLCAGGLFHLSPPPSHLRVVSYCIGQSSSLVSPSSSNVAVPNNSFKGCPSSDSSSPVFAPPLINKMPLKVFPFAILLVRPFDRGKCWLRDAQKLSSSRASLMSRRGVMIHAEEALFYYIT